VADVIPGADPVPQVLSEIQSGEGLSLSAAGRLFPGHRGNGTVDPSTVFRWVTKGMRTPDGRVMRLEAVRVGGRWLTSRGAVARFVSALTAAADPPPATSTPVPRTSTACQKKTEQAIRSLVRRGA
jgi:hypothetical protein